MSFLVLISHVMNITNTLIIILLAAILATQYAILKKMPEPPMTIGELRSKNGESRKEKMLRIPVVELRDKHLNVSVDDTVDVIIDSDAQRAVPVEVIRILE